LEAFYFGPSSSYLFGAYHPPQGVARREGIVLCYPFGQEYMRAHRAFRRLAINLAAQGFAVLRFDYRGTGDSAGDLSTVTAEHWLEDIAEAVQELTDLAAVPKVSLLGLRLGALLAAEVAQRSAAVHRLLLWDPSLSGAAYCAEIREEIAKSPGSGSKFVAPDGALYFNGFCLTPALQQSLASLELPAMAGLHHKPVAQVISHEAPAFSQIQQSLQHNPRYFHQLAPAPHDWNYVDHVGGLLWPAPIVAAIEAYFANPIV
jgi:exosortase A-associated hydrolase 2